MKYNWIFKEGSFQCAKSLDGLSNVVEVIYWEYKVTNGDESATISGETSLSKPEDGNFIPFENLTEGTVIQWLESLNSLEYLRALVDYQLNLEQTKKNKVNLNPPF